MKILHLSDLHFGKSLFEYSLLEDQRFWCVQTLDFLKKNPHDAVVIAGDLYDRSVPSAEAVELMDYFLSQLVQELRLPVLAISGNHDGAKRLDFGSGLYRASGLYMAAVPQREIERVTLADAQGEVDFWLLPYLSPADGRTFFPEQDIHSFQDTYRAFMAENVPRMNRARRNVLVAHGFFCGFSQGMELEPVTSDSEVSVGGVDITDTALFQDFDYCAFGHLHAPQRAGGEQLRYSGSPLKYSVSEERQHKALLSVTLDEAGVCSFTETELPPLHRLYSVTGSLEELARATGGQVVSEDYVFVHILTQGTELAAAQRVRNLFPNYLGIRYQSREEQALLVGGGEALRRRSLPEAFADFFSSVTGRPLTAEEAAQVERTAAQAAGREEDAQ